MGWMHEDLISYILNLLLCPNGLVFNAFGEMRIKRSEMIFKCH